MDEDTLFNRFVHLETSYGLLQRDFEKQNEAILWLTRRLNEMEKALGKLRFQLESVEIHRPPSTADDDKPPHY